MYNVIKFHKDKITTFVWEDEKNDYKEVNIKELGFPINDYFNHLVDFSDDLTVKDFIILLNDYKEDLDKHLSSYNHGFEFEIYYKEVMMEPQLDYFKECDEIEIVWDTEVIREHGVNFIMDWVSFCGRIRNFKPKNSMDIPTRGMQLSPLRDWKELPLKLNKMIYFEEISVLRERTRRIPAKLEGIKHFSLFDVLSGFIYELTGHGTPEQQISMANEVKSQIKSISESISDSVFDAKISFIPLDAGIIQPIDIPKLEKTSKKEETVEELNKKMKEYIESEKYEKAQEIKEKINSISASITTTKNRKKKG